MIDNGSSHQQHGSARLDLGASHAAILYDEYGRFDSDTVTFLRSSIPILADDGRLSHHVHVSAQEDDVASIPSLLPFRYDNDHAPHTKVALATRQMPQDPHHEDESPLFSIFESFPRSEGRYREYQQDKWLENFVQLLQFIKATGRTFIPNDYSEKDGLAQWAKRQRYQYKLRNEGKTNSLSDERVELLNSVGFIWSSHLSTFEERLYELQCFKEQMGHCIVPSQYPLNQKLSTWVKSQRRQYKLLMAGRRSNMTHERVEILNNHDFIWEIRKHSPPHQK